MESTQPTDTFEIEPSALVHWLRLANLPFSAKLITALLERFAYQPEAIFDASDSELDTVAGFLARHQVKLRDAIYAVNDRQRKYFETQQVRLLTQRHSEYPKALLNISDPPALLFARGLRLPLGHTVAIVGSRRATPYGRGVSERFARQLAERSIAVVSGGAVGIDTAAHRGALGAGGPTVAVLGCGLDVNYPVENQSLFESIVTAGTLISEYPLGAQPESWRFPYRNRLISAMTLGTLIVEAPIKSGALITVRYAAEQGKPIFVIPGNIDRPTSEGSNLLIREGAVPVFQVEDILQELRLISLPAKPEHQLVLAVNEEPAESIEPQRKKRSDAKSVPQKKILGLSAEQERVFQTLSDTPLHIDGISAQCGLDTAQVSLQLLTLELDGLIRRMPGNTYIRAV